MNIAFHEFANIFPLMQETEFLGLVEDVRVNGLNNPVVLFEGKVLDGRNRYRACLEAGFEPHTRQFIGTRVEAIKLVWSENFHRRHLGSSQAAAVVVAHETALEVEIAEENAKKQTAGLKRGTEKPVSQIVDAREPNERRTDAQLAAAHGTNRTYVAQARKLKEERPDVFQKVMGGEATLSEARREIKRDEHRAKTETAKTTKKSAVTVLPTVVLADPPWQYDFAETGSREIENHYPTATVAEINLHCPKTADNAVCFLWATAPKLEEALEILEGWGFTYKTHAVWDKQRDGMGYWFRGRHELLLVGVKGKFSPPVDVARVSSIFSEQRGKHSAKPDCVYLWIESAFPGEPKLEMYSRKERAGWFSWGNE